MARIRPREAQGTLSEYTPIAWPSAVKQIAQCSRMSDPPDADLALDARDFDLPALDAELSAWLVRIGSASRRAAARSEALGSRSPSRKARRNACFAAFSISAPV